MQTGSCIFLYKPTCQYQHLLPSTSRLQSWWYCCRVHPKSRMAAATLLKTEGELKRTRAVEEAWPRLWRKSMLIGSGSVDLS